MAPDSSSSALPLPQRPRFSWYILYVPWTDGVGDQKPHTKDVAQRCAFHDNLDATLRPTFSLARIRYILFSTAYSIGTLCLSHRSSSPSYRRYTLLFADWIKSSSHLRLAFPLRSLVSTVSLLPLLYVNTCQPSTYSQTVRRRKRIRCPACRPLSHVMPPLPLSQIVPPSLRFSPRLPTHASLSSFFNEINLHPVPPHYKLLQHMRRLPSFLQLVPLRSQLPLRISWLHLFLPITLPRSHLGLLTSMLL